MNNFFENHSWIQGGLFFGFFFHKVSWNLLLGTFHIFSDFMLSSLNPSKELQALYASNLNYLGAGVFFAALAISIPIGFVFALVIGLWYLNLTRKFRKTLSLKNNDEGRIIEAENDEKGGQKQQNMVVVKQGKKKSKISSIFESCFSYFFGKNTFGNINLRIGVQMIANDKYIDPDGLEVPKTILFFHFSFIIFN